MALGSRQTHNGVDAGPPLPPLAQKKPPFLGDRARDAGCEEPARARPLPSPVPKGSVMIKYTDVYVSTFARGLCEPNEQFIAASAGAYQSFWTFRIPFFKHSYLLIATSERLIVVDHR